MDRNEQQTIEKLYEQNSILQKENRLHKTKLTILYGFIQMLRNGYDALLHHGVNYQDLPEYKRTSALDDLEGKPLHEAQMDAVKWFQNIKSAVSAAIRRKQLKVHVNPSPTNSKH